MSRRVSKQEHFLRLLRSAEKNQQKALLKSATDEQVKALSEIILNLLAGFLPISTKTKRSLSKYKDKLRGVVDRSVSVLTLKRRWNRLPTDVLENIIKIALGYLASSGNL